MKKVIVCIILFILIAILGVGIFNFDNIIEKINYKIAQKSISKDDLKNLISSFSVEFSSYPSQTRVDYDFKNRTKTIIRYTSPDEIVPYDRFDELFDYLYNIVFVNDENLYYSLLNNYGTVYAGPEPYYFMNVIFDTNETIPAFSSNWFPYINFKTNLASWSFNNYKFPSYWNEFLEILEIDESILGEGITYDFYNSIYE